jgi:hypothetical protein
LIVRHPLEVTGGVNRKWERLGAVWRHVREAMEADAFNRSEWLPLVGRYWIEWNQRLMKIADDVCKFKDIVSDQAAFLRRFGVRYLVRPVSEPMATSGVMIGGETSSCCATVPLRHLRIRIDFSKSFPFWDGPRTLFRQIQLSG